LADIAQSGTEEPQGPAACLNRLARQSGARTLVLLESGTIVGPGWLETLLAALDANPRHGIACPSTNRAWNQLAAFPDGTEANIARTAALAAQKFGARVRSLAPLWDAGDFCLAIRRQVIDAIGPADEAYGLGPCWEMDYAVRAVRAGFLAVWAPGAYVFRHSFTERRQREEARLMDASRRRYQDTFCGLRRAGAHQAYHAHCRGEACRHFAPLPAPSAALAAAAPATSAGTLVSCIMPTSGRPEWMAQAIRYFQRQDYPNRELVIIDASRENLAALIPPDPRIRHIRTRIARSIGTMRNLAADHARGDIILHWDDDDWYAPTRISAQVQPILDGAADITALQETCFFDLDRWEFWRCTPEHHRRLFVADVHGGTLAYRRALYRGGCRYPEISLAEDAMFLQRALGIGARLAPLSGEGLFIYLRHGRNAWAFGCGQYLGAAGWQRTGEPDTLAPDRGFYLGRSRARPASLPAPGTPAIIAAAPLVSCIMPTNNRRRFVPDAIRLFQEQDYPRRELIVLDDGADAVADLMPPDPSIRYFREVPRRRVGYKRNTACAHARGEIIAHWDDDDWYAPWRLSYQVGELNAENAAICGLDRMLFLDEAARRAWEYRYAQGASAWVYGATFCYRRDLWQRHRFQDVNVGEDTQFVFGAGGGCVRVLPRCDFFVGHIHPGNVSPKQTRDPRWQPRPYDDVRALIG